MAFRNYCYITFLLCLINTQLPAYGNSEIVQIVNNNKKILSFSLDSFYTGDIQECSNWELTDDQISLFFKLAKPIDDKPLSSIGKSCEMTGQLKFKHKLWRFHINAAGYGYLDNSDQRLYFTCGFFADANTTCDDLFITVPEYFDDFHVEEPYKKPPLFTKE